MVQNSGAHAIEMNLSCPHGMGEKGMGLACGQLVSVFESGLVMNRSRSLSNTSTRQLIITAIITSTQPSTHQHNHHHTNTSSHQLIYTSTRQHINTITVIN
jgi:hypothetical protein